MVSRKKSNQLSQDPAWEKTFLPPHPPHPGRVHAGSRSPSALQSELSAGRRSFAVEQEKNEDLAKKILARSKRFQNIFAQSQMNSVNLAGRAMSRNFFPNRVTFLPANKF